MDSEHSVSGTGRSPREGGEHIPREGGVQILHAVGDGFCCERHSERVRAGGDTTGLSADIKSIRSFRIDSEGLCQPLLLQKRIGDEMTMVDFPKIDSQGFFHDWNGFAMDRFNDPHLPSAGFTRRGVILHGRERETLLKTSGRTRGGRKDRDESAAHRGNTRPLTTQPPA